MRATTTIGVALIAASFAFASLPTTSAQAKNIARIGSVAPTGTPWSALLSRTKKRLEKAATSSLGAGAFSMKLYLGGKLGSEAALIRRCQKGQLAGIAVSTGAMGQAVPELYATELPYLFDNAQSAYKALDAAKPLVSELLAAKGFVFYMWGENGYRHFASKEKHFSTPADLKGMKMRSQPAMPHVEMYKALGAGASTISVGEVSSSLANGVVTGYDNTLLYAYATQWHKEVEYVTLSAHIYQAAIIVWCKPWFDKQSPELQKLLTAIPAGEEELGRKSVRMMNKRLKDQYTKAGVKVLELSSAARSAFKQATSGVRDIFLGKTSAKGKQLLQILESNR
jgi:TRAP-type C4-dicarboxylate transport system substrate-binding protein